MGRQTRAATPDRGAGRILRPKAVASLSGKILRKTQELTDLCRKPDLRVAERCARFSALLKDFIETELKHAIQRDCRLVSFMVWNSERKSYHREAVYNIPEDVGYDEKWSEEIFRDVFLGTRSDPSGVEDRITLTYWDRLRKPQTRRLAELGSELIFSGAFEHRPVIIINLAENSREDGHKGATELPNIFEVDLTFSRDKDLIQDIQLFKKSHYDGKDVESTSFRESLKQYLSDSVTPEYFSTWEAEFPKRKLNRAKNSHRGQPIASAVRSGRRSDAGSPQSVLDLLKDKNYELRDLFYTKVINLLIFPDAKYMYFIPADSIQQDPSGGFCFTLRSPIEVEEILYWCQLAQVIFNIVASIPNVEQQMERALFAHRHLGVLAMLEEEVRRFGERSPERDRLSAMMIALKAAFLPFRGDKYDDTKLFSQSLEKPFECYVDLAVQLALRRLQSREETQKATIRFLEEANGAAEFLRATGWRPPSDDDLRRFGSTIAHENYGYMLIQILDQALYHTYLAKSRGSKGTIRLLLEAVTDKSGKEVKLITRVYNPASSAHVNPELPKDVTELARLGKYFIIEDVHGPGPVDNHENWLTSFTLFIWG